jgi:peptidoglycan/LPS O-acetylase OafA/YrhL
MTPYLWHMPVLLGVHLLFDYLGHPRCPGQPDFLVISVVQLLIVIAVVAVLFLTLRPLENNPLSGWGGAPTIISVWRGTAVGTLLCVTG